MTPEALQAALEKLPTSTDEDGWILPPAERHITFYAAHEGVALTVGNVVRVKVEAAMVMAETRKGELYQLALADVFALATDAPQAGERKAGFGSR